MTLLASLRDWLKAQQLDAVLLSSRQNKQPHLGISTGSGYVVISRESAHILVDSRYFVEVEARAQGYQLHLFDATNTLTTIVNQIIADEQLQTLGFEGQQVSWETAHRWKSELNAKLVSATPDVLRQIKTPEEVEIIRLACGIADRGAEHIRRFIQAGMSEREIAAELEWFMRQQGAEKASFDTIVASGWRGALPHGKASDKIVAAGEFVTLDFGALYQGYCSDMTRTLLVNGEGVSCLTSIRLSCRHSSRQSLQFAPACAASRLTTPRAGSLPRLDLATISVITLVTLSALKSMKIRVFHRGTPRRYSQACC